MTPLHVAVLDEELPFPLTSGKRIRTFSLIKRLASRHRVTYLAHRNADPAEAEDAARALRAVGVTPVVVERRVPPKSGAGFYARLLANVASPLPYSVASHRSAELTRAARELAARDPVSLWHCEWTPYAATLRDAFPDAAPPSLVVAHNVESHIWQRLADNEPSRLKRAYIRHQHRKFAAFERWAYSSASTTVAVSESDAGCIRRDFAGRNVTVVDNGVDVAFFQPGRPADRDPFRVLFLGSLDWRPNIDAVDQLLTDIVPTVRAVEPRFRLTLVGRQPSPALRQRVAQTPGVELFADVADVRPYLHGAGMLAVPLRIGGGSRLKILEALATGLPVVTSTVGVEGLHLEADRHVTIADGPEAFVRTLLGGMKTARAMQLQGQRGRSAVVERYDWDPLADRLDAVWRETAGAPLPAVRRAG